MKPKVFGIGELLWDLLPAGRQLGGAPANFAYHASALGAEVGLISRVGNDPLGHEALDRIRHLGVSTDGIEVDEAKPTGTVSVDLAPDGQPLFVIHEHVAWDHLSGATNTAHSLSNSDALCFGTLGQRSEPSRSTIQALVASSPPSSLRIFDINLRQQFYSPQGIVESLSLCNFLKVNESELPVLSKLFQLTGDDRSRIATLVSRFQLKGAAFTLGARGSLVYFAGDWSEVAAREVRVTDTIGAGDAFTAALALGLLSGWPLQKAHHQANAIAAHVCSCPGATPPIPATLRDPYFHES